MIRVRFVFGGTHFLLVGLSVVFVCVVISLCLVLFIVLVFLFVVMHVFVVPFLVLFVRFV